jgi:CheY-like chemotaxis protein
MARRVLIVDDNRAAADLLVLLLTHLGHEARSAYDGAMALAVAESYRPDTIFIDLVMPGMDGYELSERLRNLMGPDCRLVALTAFAVTMTREATLAAGFDFVVAKPATAEVLEQVLSRGGRAESSGLPT